MSLLADAVWPDVPTQGAVLLVPVGSIEQHGPHLPLGTDTVIAQAVADGVAELLEGGDDRVLVAPPLTYGSSGEHQAFPGTCSIGAEALHQVLVELVRSARTWARRVVFVNAHGGNVVALRRAVTQLAGEGHEVAWASCRTEQTDLHAGRTETSLMLHLQPWNVRIHRAQPGCTEPLAQILPALMAGRLADVSSNGVLGDPTGATAAEGHALLRAMARQVAGEIRAGWRDEHGMLASS
jgi:mycofactocin precursor peptide peptidase